MYLNLAKRSFKLPGVAGARVRAGASPRKTPEGIGDCVLLDFATGLFALSDSSDRDPGRSREFLLQFDNMISRTAGTGRGHTFKSLELVEMAEKITAECGQILEAMRGSASCTFTGVLILKTDAGLNALLFHTGDSCLYEYDPFSRTLTPLAEQNFWMVGRTARLFQITQLSVKPQALFVLSTDGILAGTRETTQLARLAEIIHHSRVEDIPDEIMNTDVPAEEFRDDAALIALSPQSLEFANTRIIMGGTTDLQEREYAERCRSKVYVNANVPLTVQSSWLDQVF